MPALKNDERGVGSIVIIGIAVVVLAIAGVTVWKLSSKKTTSSTASTTATTKSVSTVAVSSSCLKAFHDSSLCAFANHTNISSQQYVATGTATSSSGTKSTFTVENDGKGNTDVAYGSNGKQISSISLDGVTYVQSAPGSTWLGYAGTGLGAASSVPNPTSGFNVNFTSSTPAGVSVTKVGTAACGKLSCNEYKVVDSATPTTTEYVYFDTQDYLLRQWTSNDTSTGVAVDLTFTYQPVTIAKPSPVQMIST